MSMEPLQNKDLRRILFFTVLLGFSFGCVYIYALESYFFRRPSLNLEILQNFEIFRDFLKVNNTNVVNKQQQKQYSGIIDFAKALSSFSENVRTTGGTLNVDKKASKEKGNEKAAEEKQNEKVNEEKRNEKVAVSSDVSSKEKIEPVSSKDLKYCRLNRTALGSIYVDENPVDILTLKEKGLDFVQTGGQWAPKGCRPRAELALVIPYRNRETHLGIFLHHMHKYLKNQLISYRIFVVEQDDNYAFNRGKLMNIGFKEAMEKYPYNCVAFHDIDLLPEDSRNDYACPSSPRHLSASIDKFGYELIYPELFGGVEMFFTDDFKTINGFSNSFWGWGAEDDNLFFRIMSHHMGLSRPSMAVGRYKMLKHLDMERWGAPNRKSILKMSKNIKYIGSDGLSSLQYKVNRVLEMPLFTLIKVDLQMHNDRLLGVHEYF